ncbi:hypothetical protein DICPUDRAFT_153236 [Dictyostelium purpureum]|uniref:t-SNARE coiled-coil homology domain-containing protein n=1 Tax=Dictyostelium purpureum TaxID=5786 RepID=F0ZND8_DICPU|nr:uncharacterized protein DICPUDRAFT_153236 [Dictyostelium purpureum]EGC34546.1 hypothetical protein DICPUDRAFT_153236 [Dictyostelium purpureum]|eukprot:XP_003288922.1 hypothetical protein DICPUDRAFT_153236 [Dictyostelium purpureum]
MTDRSPLLGNNNNNNDIISRLTQFFADLSDFEKSIRDYGTGRDTTTFRAAIHKKKLVLGEDLKIMTQQIKQLPSSKLQKFQQEKIIKQFKEGQMKFEELLNLSNRKENQSQPITPIQNTDSGYNNNNNNGGYGYNNNNNNNNNNFGNNNNNNRNNGYGNVNTRGGFGNTYQQEQPTYDDDVDRLEQVLEETDDQEFYNRIVDERNAQTKELVKEVAIISDIMKDISGLVEEQRVMLEQADDNVGKADIAVEDSVQELEKAYVYKSSARKKIIILMVCLGCTFAAVGVFLAIYYGLIKKKK